jgi:hypothetical protein
MLEIRKTTYAEDTQSLASVLNRGMASNEIDNHHSCDVSNNTKVSQGDRDIEQKSQGVGDLQEETVGIGGLEEESHGLGDIEQESNLIGGLGEATEAAGDFKEELEGVHDFKHESNLLGDIREGFSEDVLKPLDIFQPLYVHVDEENISEE